MARAKAADVVSQATAAVESPSRIITICLGVAVLCMISLAVTLPRFVVPSIPVDRLQIETGWADETTCANCHEQGRTFWETGHAQTLHPVDDAESAALLKALLQNPAARDEGTTVRTEGGQFLAVNQLDKFRSESALGWCFGSGKHARTWVGTLPDSRGVTDLLEFRWSWYREIEGFDITPGQPDEPGAGYYAHLGLLFDHPKARRCFSCHATSLPLDAGEIQQSHIRAGVTCQRCHGPRAEHVATDGIIGDGFWSRASQQESVEHCAECHRSAAEQDPSTIVPDNPDIARFQPVGLVQSACFQKSSMTCVTCHDPHRPLDAQDSLGVWQCSQCHDGARNDHPRCRAGHVDDCVRCHMPKVSMDRPIRFTDHWIRIRENESPP